MIEQIVIPTFDIHNKEFSSGTSDDRNTTNIYELCTSLTTPLSSKLFYITYPTRTTTLPSNSFTMAFKGLKIKISTTLLSKQTRSISYSSIIPIYDIEEIDINKFKNKL